MEFTTFKAKCRELRVKSRMMDAKNYKMVGSQINQATGITKEGQAQSPSDQPFKLVLPDQAAISYCELDLSGVI